MKTKEIIRRKYWVRKINEKKNPENIETSKGKNKNFLIKIKTNKKWKNA